MLPMLLVVLLLVLFDSLRLILYIPSLLTACWGGSLLGIR
jgi:hypothetical protein